MRRISCPSCDESKKLTGSPSDEGIRIECGRCGTVWLRDSIPHTCATCGGTDVEERSRALTQYSRGTQLSIVGLGSVLLCRECDRQMIEWSDSGRAVPFNYRPAALDPEAAEERDCGSDGDVLITP